MTEKETRERVSLFSCLFFGDADGEDRKPRAEAQTSRTACCSRRFFMPASQNHRAFICCTSFPNRACSVGLRSADCRCQPGYCTACSRGTSASARFRAWPRTGCRTSCRHFRATIRALTMSVLPGRAHISAATSQFLRYLDWRNAPEAPAGCTGFDNQA